MASRCARPALGGPSPLIRGLAATVAMLAALAAMVGFGTPASQAATGLTADARCTATPG